MKKGIVKGYCGGYDITVRVQDKGDGTVHITTYARKLMFPRPGFAKSLLYQISEKIGQ